MNEIKELGIKALLEGDQVQTRLKEILGKKAATFSTSVLQIVNSSELLKHAEPQSILNAAMVSASLGLPLSNQLGFAWIVPYKQNKKVDGKWEEKILAQFQIGYRGFVQLALRTGQYEKLNTVAVYENQFVSWNSLTEVLDGNFTIPGSGEIVGYCSFFRLLSGFEKVVFWTKDQAQFHGKKYSKTFTSGPWTDNFDGMAMKSVLRAALGKWGIMSVEIELALSTDQAVIENSDGSMVQFIDNPGIVDDNKEAQRFLILAESCSTVDKLNEYFNACSHEVKILVNEDYFCKLDLLNQIEDSKEAEK